MLLVRWQSGVWLRGRRQNWGLYGLAGSGRAASGDHDSGCHNDEYNHHSGDNGATMKRPEGLHEISLRPALKGVAGFDEEVDEDVGAANEDRCGEGDEDTAFASAGQCRVRAVVSERPSNRRDYHAGHAGDE